MKIQVNEISIHKRKLLNKTCVPIEDNQIYTISGNNGVGKTLLLKRLFFECVNKGCNAVYVEQSNDFVIMNCSLLENISMSGEEKDWQKAQELLVKYDLEYLLEHTAYELSGGEKRMVCLLRAFFQQTRYIFIDEPTNDLDYVMVNKMQEIFEDLRKTCTIIMVTHDDRMINIATGVWRIMNQELIFQNNPASEFQSKKELTEVFNTEHSSVLLYQKLSKDIISGIVLLLMSVVCIYFLIGSSDAWMQESGEVGAHEVDVFIPTSQIGAALLSDGAIPVSMLGGFDDSLSLKQQLDLFNSCLDNAKEMPVNFGLEVLDTHENKKFEIEYYDLVDSEYYNVLDRYLTYYGNGENTGLDTNRYFFSDVSDSGDVLQFDETHYKKCREMLFDELGNDLECSFLVVSLNQNEDLESFIQTGAFDSIMGGNYFVRSKETMEFYNQIMSFQSRQRLISGILILGMILVFVNNLSYIILLMSNRKKLLCFKNMGRKKEEALSLVKARYGNDKIKIIMIVGVLAVTFFVLQRLERNMLVSGYVNVILLAVLFRLDTGIRRFISKRYVKRIWEWKYR